jgi:hypothetical protein
LQKLSDAESDVQQHLPISATVESLSLMVERFSGRWERSTTFLLTG